MTSNYEPSTLYPDGLHRDRILPAIKLIEERMDVLNVDIGIDYRRRTLARVRTYLTPITQRVRDELQANFDRLSDTAPQQPVRSEEHTSELQSLMRISYAVFCLKKTTYTLNTH